MNHHATIFEPFEVLIGLHRKLGDDLLGASIMVRPLRRPRIRRRRALPPKVLLLRRGGQRLGSERREDRGCIRRTARQIPCCHFQRAAPGLPDPRRVLQPEGGR
jgi:hypothetical protein